jgi:hypothetical protein
MCRAPTFIVARRALVLLLLLAGCKTSEDTILLVHADLNPPGQAPAVRSLSVTVSDGSQQSDSHSFAPPQGTALKFPTSFSLQLPRGVHGPISLKVAALDADGVTLAEGARDRLEIKVGQHQETSVDLDCRRGCQPDNPDGGSTDAPTDTGADMGNAGRPCGNGELNEGELCDPGIPAGRPGACPPPNCSDGQACTVDRATDWGCRMTCQHTVITASAGGDGCCPAGATAAQDPDCSATCGNGTVEASETCDTAIAAGLAGACPAAGGCSDGDPCTEDALLSAGTCAAVCAFTPILTAAAGDQCCPPGGTSASDPDCPAVCGNRRKDPGETCDRAVPAGMPDACATVCQDSDPCTTDVLVGSGCQVECQHLPITRRAGGDLCCPAGATRDLDSDCPARCNNGVVEPGETCDSMIPAGMPGACPTACPAMAGSCILRRLDGRAEDCSARCVEELSTLCQAQADGCCPMGCTAASDPDCSGTCNNGSVEPGETCDTAIPAGMPGACPTRCGDGNSCTADLLVSQGTCNARCAYAPITLAMSGDGCCPEGSSGLLDSDCPAVCGNKLVEPPRETCDVAVPAGLPGSCPAACPELPRGCMQPRLTGSPGTCNVLCELDTIKTCRSGDGCCPEGCARNSDEDCAAVCGNAVLEMGEVCDRGITAGKPGSCAAVCDDYTACTTDVTLGRVSDCTRRCLNQPISVCRGGDGCCPAGCTVEQDRDCAVSCGNKVIEAGETCDPPSSCPTTCADDGDPCTADRLRGDAKACNAHCEHQPILTCSGASTDRCCPTGCTGLTDADCGTSPAKAPSP